jgi:hypothetical protein
MADRTQELASLVAVLLPYDHESVDINPDGEQEHADLVAASIAAFSVASVYAFAKPDQPDRRLFCRQAAAMTDGYLKAWMVEATLRSIDGQTDAFAGTDPYRMRLVPLVGLDLLRNLHLSIPECLRLRRPALERAVEIRPDISVERSEPRGKG